MTPIQIFGTKKCKDTQKAIRFFRERGVTQIHFVDISEKPISKGELESVTRSVPLEQLVDKESKEFEKLNLKYMKYDPMDKLLEHPLLLKTPIVRFQKKAALGFQPDLWKTWAEEAKKK